MANLSIYNVPVLMYHRVNPVVIDRNTVHTDNFAAQLEYLHNGGFQTISLSQLYQAFTKQQPLPPKPVILTFDDGYIDNFINALPLLLRYKMKGAVFVIPGMIGDRCNWLQEHDCNRLMSWDQLKEWTAAGMEIGSHTVNHPMLSRLTDEEIAHELCVSKETLERELATTIDFVCYPYGDLDDRVKGIAKTTGYKGGLAIFNNVSFKQEDMFAIPRVGISSRLPLWEFKLKVSKLHRCFISMRKMESDLKKMLRRNHG